MHEKFLTENSTEPIDKSALPFWLCQPYVRPTGEKSIPPIDNNETKIDNDKNLLLLERRQVLAIKRKHKEEVDRLSEQFGVSKNRAKKLMRFPSKIATTVEEISQKQVGYNKCACGNPLVGIFINFSNQFFVWIKLIISIYSLWNACIICAKFVVEQNIRLLIQIVKVLIDCYFYNNKHLFNIYLIFQHINRNGNEGFRWKRDTYLSIVFNAILKLVGYCILLILWWVFFCKENKHLN